MAHRTIVRARRATRFKYSYLWLTASLLILFATGCDRDTDKPQGNTQAPKIPERSVAVVPTTASVEHPSSATAMDGKKDAEPTTAAKDAGENGAEGIGDIVFGQDSRTKLKLTAVQQLAIEEIRDRFMSRARALVPEGAQPSSADAAKIQGLRKETVAEAVRVLNNEQRAELQLLLRQARRERQNSPLKFNAAQIDLSNLEISIDAFEIDVGRYPSSAEGLKVLLAANGIAGWKGPYRSSASLRDPWGQPYIYRFPGRHKGSYDLLTVGPDGNEGTDDDLHNWHEN